jgi:hypothetical protein
MNLRDRMKTVSGIRDAIWYGADRTLVIYYDVHLISKETVKALVIDQIDIACLQDAIAKIDFVEEGVLSDV